MLNRKKLEEADKKYRAELSAINDDLAKMVFTGKMVLNTTFHNNMLDKSKEHIESIFWDMSALQDIRNFFIVSPKIEQKLKNYRSFIELHKKIADTWFNKHTQKTK